MAAVRTAELLGERDARQPELDDLLPVLDREAVLLVDLVRDRRDLGAREVAHHLAHHLLFLREIEGVLDLGQRVGAR